MRVLLLASSLALLSGCIGAGGLQTRMARRSGEVMYLHDARATERQQGTVSLAAFTIDAALPAKTAVRKTGGYVVPLLLVNVWKGEYQSTLGAEQITNDTARFMQESFTEELKRSAKYAFVERDGDLQVEMRVTKITTGAPIVESGNFFFLLLAWSYSTSVYAGPVDVSVEAEAVVRKGGVEVLRKPVVGRARTGALTRKGSKIEDLTTAMIEGLSLAVKGLNDAAVGEINAL